MKCCVVGLILASQVLTIPCHSQPTTVTLNMKGNLIEIMAALQRTGCCQFTYDPDDIPPVIITVRFKNFPAPRVTEIIFHNQPVKANLDTLMNGICYFSIYRESSTSASAANLPPATVESYTNGIHQLNMATTTGSVYVLLKPDRVISPNALDQLPGLVSGLEADPNVNNSLNMAIRGRSSLYGINSPYLVLDGFVNFANPQDFNPYDIQSYTVLKDPASAGIWGTFGANGVIAATSYTGEHPDSFRFNMTQNVSTLGKPRLSYVPRIRIPSYIGMEEQLFGQGYYDAILPTSQAITPVVALLYQQQSHHLAPDSVSAGIDYLSRFDLRNEELRYLYRNSFNEQIHLSATGNSKRDYYYLSAGYDLVPSPLVRNDYQRLTTHLSNTWRPIPCKLKIATTLQLTATRILDNNTGNIPVSYPYGPLADNRGNPFPVNNLYNPFYIDTAGGGQLMNWQYRPLQELALADNQLHRNSGYLDARITYTIIGGLRASIEYRQFLSHSLERDLYDQNSFFARNLINLFSVVGTTGVIHNIPPGAMLFSTDTTSQSHHLRLKFSYSTPCDSPHQLTIFAGADLNDLSIVAHGNWQYGYDPRTGKSTPVNFADTYTDFVNGGSEMIPYTSEPQGQYYRYLSVYSDVSYSYREKYSFYGSLRKDATNIVGAAANREWAPFWALGMGWDLLHDRKRDTGFLAFMKLRSSYGCSGNIGDRVAYLQIQSLGPNLWSAPESGIYSAPDPGLTWETTYMWNIGVDYGFFKDKVSPGGRLRGSLDGYLKRSVNLLGYDSVLPSAGIPVFFGNSAAIRGHGLEWVVNSENIRSNRNGFRWSTTLLFSWATDRVSRYLLHSTANSDYIDGRYPKVGKSSTSLFAYDWAGLDPATGDPTGYLNHQPSNNYASIGGDSGGMHTYSSYLPQVFGSLMHTFQYRRWQLSALFTFKAAYWFRRPSINYTQMLMGDYPGTRDYDERWQVPGDEKKTSVPSFPGPVDWNNTARDGFYQNSSVLVCKGDHVRWQDLRLDYIVKEGNRAGRSAYQIDLYAYISGLGIIWRSNRYGIDPDAAVYGTVPVSKVYSLGMRMKF